MNYGFTSVPKYTFKIASYSILSSQRKSKYTKGIDSLLLTDFNLLVSNKYLYNCILLIPKCNLHNPFGLV